MLQADPLYRSLKQEKKKESEVAQLCPTPCNPMDCSLPGTSAHESPGNNAGVLPFPSPGDLPNPGIKPGSPILQADALTSELPGKLPWWNLKIQLIFYLSPQGVQYLVLSFFFQFSVKHSIKLSILLSVYFINQFESSCLLPRELKLTPMPLIYMFFFLLLCIFLCI